MMQNSEVAAGDDTDEAAQMTEDAKERAAKKTPFAGAGEKIKKHMPQKRTADEDLRKISVQKQGKMIFAVAMAIIIVIGIVVGCLAAFNRKNVNVGTDTLFHEGLVPVKLGELWGYADTSGKTEIEPQFEYAGKRMRIQLWIIWDF